MTVEATIVIPFFLFFLFHILFSFDVLRLHGNLTAALHQTGNQMCFYAYAYDQSGMEEVIPKEAGSLVLSELYVKNKVIEYLGKDYLDHTCIVNGSHGLQFLRSSIMTDNDIIELTASYQVKPKIEIYNFFPLYMENRYYGRAWTGYDVTVKEKKGIEEDLLVYVTESGDVYHISRACSYLNPSIRAAPLIGIEKLRNESREKYSPCPDCYTEGIQALGYITNHGNRVHTSLQCPGLKRTVYSIRLSEINGKGRCSKCG